MRNRELDNEYNKWQKLFELEQLLQKSDVNKVMRQLYLWQIGAWNDLLTFDTESCDIISYLFMAYAHQQLGEHDRATSCYKNYLLNNGSKKLFNLFMLSSAYNQLGIIMQIGGRKTDAVKYIKKSFELLNISDEYLVFVNHRLNVSSLNDNLISTQRMSVCHNTVLPAPNTLLSTDILLDTRWLLFSLDESNIALSSRNFSQYVNNKYSPNSDIVFNTRYIKLDGKEKFLVHVENDYIPKKIIETSNYYERSFLDYLSNYYIPDSYIFDVGANIGNDTMYFASELNAKVVSFEPQPHNYSCLEANVFLNNISEQVKIYNLGLGQRNSELYIKMQQDNNFGSFSCFQESKENSHKVDIVPLDSFICGDLDKSGVSILKIDVEGMESDVLLGGQQFIEKYHPIIALECLDIDLYINAMNILSKLSYTPVNVINASPTFIFLHTSNHHHLQRYLSLAKNKLINKINWVNLEHEFENKQSIIANSNIEFVKLSDSPAKLEVFSANHDKIALQYKSLLNNDAIKNGSKLVVAVKFYSGNNSLIKDANVNVNFSDSLDSYYLYLDNTYGVYKNTKELLIPNGTYKIVFEFRTFYPKPNDKIEISNIINILFY